MLEFRLIYQGILLGSDKNSTNSEHKHSIRRYLHPQLKNLWNLKHPLKARMEFA